MQPLPAETLLRVWEQARSRHPLDRGLLLFSLAEPESLPDSLADRLAGPVRGPSADGDDRSSLRAFGIHLRRSDNVYPLPGCGVPGTWVGWV